MSIARHPSRPIFNKALNLDKGRCGLPCVILFAIISQTLLVEAKYAANKASQLTLRRGTLNAVPAPRDYFSPVSALTAIPTVPVQLDLTAPVKICIIIIVQMHRNEHEFYFVKSLCTRQTRRRGGAGIEGNFNPPEYRDSPVRRLPADYFTGWYRYLVLCDTVVGR
jgi:hypothetical protein